PGVRAGLKARTTSHSGPWPPSPWPLAWSHSERPPDKLPEVLLFEVVGVEPARDLPRLVEAIGETQRIDQQGADGGGTKTLLFGVEKGGRRAVVLATRQRPQPARIFRFAGLRFRLLGNPFLHIIAAQDPQWQRPQRCLCKHGMQIVDLDQRSATVPDDAIDDALPREKWRALLDQAGRP